MYNITLAEIQEFNHNSSSQKLQRGWQFDPETPLEIISFIGEPLPANVAIATRINDYLLSHGADFTNIYVMLEHVWPLINGQRVQIFTISGEIWNAPVPGYELSSSNLDVTTTLDFGNMLNIPRGSYNVVLGFNAIGRKADNTLHIIELTEYKVSVHRLQPEQMLITPAHQIRMSYHLGGSLPPPHTRDIFVNGVFTVTAGKHIALTGSNLTLQTDINGIKTYSGIGSQTITISLESTIDNEPGLENEYIATLAFDNGITGAGVAVFVELFGVDTLIVSPSRLEFSAVKGFVEALGQNIYLSGTKSYTISWPNWLEVTGGSSGTGSGTRNVRPVHSDNLLAGTYTGSIVISAGDTVLIVDVVHEVGERIIPGFQPVGLNFTKDRAGITQLFEEDYARIDFALRIRAYAPDMRLKTDKRLDLVKGLFNKKADFWLGEVVHKAMPDIRKLEDIGMQTIGMVGIVSHTGIGNRVVPFFNPSETDLSVKFINRHTGNQKGKEYEYAVRFLKGRRPARFNGRAGIVDFFVSPIRVTPKSVAVLPIYRNEPRSKVDIYRNGVLSGTIYPDGGEHKYYGILLYFDPFTAGDVIDIEIDSSPFAQTYPPTPPLVQRYIVFPEGMNSYHIAWITEHGTPQLLEFTGDYEFRSERKAIKNLVFQDYLEYTQKLGNERVRKFSANTGFILKSNQERIDDLVDANIAWIVFKDGTPPIEVVPADAKITSVDSAANTYQYTLEFTINPSHELANHTF